MGRLAAVGVAGIAVSVAVAILSCSILNPLDGFLDGEGGTTEAASTADAGDALAVADADAASTDADARTVRCPPSRCTDSKVCCALTHPDSVYRRYECRVPGACHPDDQNGIVVLCSSPADCAARGMPGTICCMFRDSSARMQDFGCVPKPTCAGLHGIMCDPVAPECGEGMRCAPDPNDYYGDLYFCIPL